MLNKGCFGLSVALFVLTVSHVGSFANEKLSEQKIQGVYGGFENSVRLETSRLTKETNEATSFLMFDNQSSRQNTKVIRQNQRPQCVSANRFAIHCMH